YLQLRLRPVLGASQAPVIVSGQPLSALNALSPEAIARLEAERIFTVDDLLRVANHPAGRHALVKLDLGTDLGRIQERAAVLTLPGIPSEVTEALLQIGIGSPTEFVKADATDLARSLSERTKLPIEPKHVSTWQQQTEKLIRPQLDGGQTSIA